MVQNPFVSAVFYSVSLFSADSLNAYFFIGVGMELSASLPFSSALINKSESVDLESIRGALPAPGIDASEMLGVGPSIQISASDNDYIIYDEPKQIQLIAYSAVERAEGVVSTFAQGSLRSSAESRLQNAPLQLGELLERGDKSYTQDVRQYTRFESFGVEGKSSSVDLAGFNDIKNTQSASVMLQLTTKDGDEINFSLKSYSGYGRGEDGRSAGFEGVEITFDFEGDLSKEEQEQIDVFIEKLNQAANGYFKDANIDMKALDLSGFTSFSDVELSLRGGKVSGESLRFDLSFHDDDDARSIKVNLNGDRSELSVDKNSLGSTVSEQQKIAALTEYLDLLDQSADEAQAKESATSLMKDTFSIAFNNLEFDAKNAVETQNTKSLIGLPDFEYSFESKGERPNKEYRPLEYQGFSVKLSLDTQVQQSDLDDKSIITQTQQFDLSAAYYSPAGQMKRPDFDTQTYQYTKLDRSSEKVTQLVSEHRQLVSAITTESGENNSHMLEYQFGKVVDEDVDGSSYAEVKEFTEQAKQEAGVQDLELLSLLVVDPYQAK